MVIESRLQKLQKRLRRKRRLKSSVVAVKQMSLQYRQQHVCAKSRARRMSH